jgi:hypothetical protein
MITYHPHMKRIHNFSFLIFEIFRKSQYKFKMFKFQKSNSRCKWVIMCMTYEPSRGLWYKKLNLKIGFIFSIIWCYGHKMYILAIFVHLKKIIFIKKMVTQVMWFIEGIVNSFWEHVAKNNPSKINFYEKIKMLRKNPFVVESFVTISSFDYDCTLGLFSWMTANESNYQKLLTKFFMSLNHVIRMPNPSNPSTPQFLNLCNNFYPFQQV